MRGRNGARGGLLHREEVESHWRLWRCDNAPAIPKCRGCLDTVCGESKREPDAAKVVGLLQSAGRRQVPEAYLIRQLEESEAAVEGPMERWPLDAGCPG